MKFYKYHGAGNDFLIADGRDIRIDLAAGQIAALCDRHTGLGADGLMVLEKSGKYDFAMRYYNSDGSGGMMCGNGGRCIAAFAADLGYANFKFEAPDGCHEAELVQGQGSAPDSPFSVRPRTIRLKMADVSGAVAYLKSDGNASEQDIAHSFIRHGCGAGSASCGLYGFSDLTVLDWYMDTGTRHFVRFVRDLDSCDVVGEGRTLRYDSRFAPIGVNVNFVHINAPGDITVRTYEKGVEDETLACGTGIVASAMASWLASAPGVLHAPAAPPADGTDVHRTDCDDLSAERPALSPEGAVRCLVHARIADLSVSFVPSIVGTAGADISGQPMPVDCCITSSSSASVPFAASEVYLTGPAAFVGTMLTDIV